MKNLTSPVFVLFASVILLALIYVGCENYSESVTQEQDYSIPNAAEIVTDYNDGKLDFKKGEYLRGSVEVKTITDSKKGSMVDFYFKGENSTYIHYVLQMSGNGDAFKETKFEKAEILFVRRSIVINSLTSSYRVLLTVDENVFEPLVAIGGFTHEAIGVGLIRQVSKNDISLRNGGFGGGGTIGIHCLCCQYQGGELQSCEGSTATPGEDGCDSGGSSSSSCSLSNSSGESCSVECNPSSAASSACCWDS